MGRYFISGGAGFIDGHLTEGLLKEGNAEVAVYDNLSSGTRTYNFISSFPEES